jgi:transcriptional regulator with XRE-family HTH domain
MEDIMPENTASDYREHQGPPSDFSDSIFARKLREIRQQAGVTQQQIADRMTGAGHKLHRSAVAKIELGERPVTIGEAVQLAGVLGVPLMEMVTDRDAATELERQHAARVEAQINVRSLQHEAAERHKLLAEQQILYENVVQRLGAAQRRLRELGGELPWNTPGVPPGLQPEIFGPPDRGSVEASLAALSRPLPTDHSSQS